MVFAFMNLLTLSFAVGVLESAVCPLSRTTSDQGRLRATAHDLIPPFIFCVTTSSMTPYTKF